MRCDVAVAVETFWLYGREQHTAQKVSGAGVAPRYRRYRRQSSSIQHPHSTAVRCLQARVVQLCLFAVTT